MYIWNIEKCVKKIIKKRVLSSFTFTITFYHLLKPENNFAKF